MLPEIFDERRNDYADVRAELKQQLSETEWRAAARTTLNAHYTDAALASTIWQVLSDNGFGSTGGRVLEPGCGAGTFLGLAPEHATFLLGVELDPVTAGIAAALYPHAQIRAESFADTPIPHPLVDLAIGNVPFGDITLHDPIHNRGRHSLHNHFIIKALHATRPGGVAALITSHWTMDATDPAARRDINVLADLIAAIRLPSSTHRAAAGTSVITDLLILRRRPDEQPPAAQIQWDATVSIGGDQDRDVRVNEYFLNSPAHVLGQLGTRSGQFGPELAVEADGDVPAAFRTALVTALQDEAGSNPAWSLFEPVRTIEEPETTRVPSAEAENHITRTAENTFTIVAGGHTVPHEVPRSQQAELAALLGLRDTAVALLEAEAATSTDTEHTRDLRRLLNRRYEAYSTKFGPINRITYRRTGRTDPDTGEDRRARILPPQGRFRLDPHSPVVYALENFDPSTGTATKATIFAERVIAARTPHSHADSPADAIAICLDRHGTIELPAIAALLGTDEHQARQALQGLAFTDPEEPEKLVPAAEYLSGNVRRKLTTAIDAAHEADDDRWEENIAALQQVIPADLTPAEISAHLGAAWIDAPIIHQFLTELLEDASVQVEHPGGSTWTVRGYRSSVLASSTYGTGRASAIDLIAAKLEQRQIRVMDTLEDGTRVLNPTETVAAQAKADELDEKFADWLWDDPDRAERLARTYNDTFNSIVLRSYDGASLQLPGLSAVITPFRHQVAAVARIRSEPAVLLAHEVGAGKTAEMVMGAMELRRLGLIRKPAVIVPNHMLEQFSREWIQLYPQAQILATSIQDLAKDKRRQIIGRIATGDWDGVIMSRSAFERIALSPAEQKAYFDGQIDQLRIRLQNSRSSDGLTVKRLEGMLARAEERLKELTDRLKDPGITFEETGIDYLFIDEAHGYKNLRRVSNISDANHDGSARASDLDMKIQYLRRQRGSRVVTFATATPIANSVAEAYTMQQYLRPDILTEAAITDFDSWASTFGQVTTELELSPDGTRFRQKARFAKFQNVPELMRTWRVFADVKTATDLDLTVPAVAGGAARTIVIPAGEGMREFMATLAERADRIQGRQVDPTEDNMLRVSSHGRLAALDLRLVGTEPDPDTKLRTAAETIAEIYHRTHDRSYEPAPRPGTLQIVFCDQGVPNGHGRWNAYDELAHQLTQLGVPEARVRFMQSARNDREKGELFAACRSGQVAVLIGSTERMGVGTNIQTRAVALHHIDCPWRPADIAQRDGRIVRQGNLNTEVEILRYVTEGSFDAYCWQTVERKATFIHQLMRGSLDIREIEDIGDVTLSAAETKALATGDPRIREKAQLDSDLNRLERLERFHRRNQRSLTERIATCQKQLPHLQREHEQLTGILQALPATKPESFTITIGTTRFTKRAAAATEIRARLLQIPPLSRTGTTTATRIGTINDLPIRAQHVHGMYDSIRIDLAGVPRSTIDIRPRELDTERPLGIITKLENCVSRIPRSLQEVATEIAKTHNDIDQAEAQIGQPFPRHDELEELRRRCIALTEELAKTHTEIDTPAIGGPVAVQAEQHNTGWAELCRAIEPTIVSDPYWPTLTKALEKCSAHRVDIPAAINRAHTAAPLPAADPARTLHYRLVAEHPAALLGGTAHQPTPPDTPTAPILDHHHAPSVRPPQGPHHGR